MKKTICVRVDSQRYLSKEEGLAYHIVMYILTSKPENGVGRHKIFPTFNSERQSELDCYPPGEQVLVTKTRAGIKLQVALNKMVKL